MNRHEFNHEAMATTFTVVIADHPRDYARQAATAAFRELERLENELSRYVESSDIARANRIGGGETISIGDDTLQCLLMSAEVAAVTGRAFDITYASDFGSTPSAHAVAFTVDPSAHTLTSCIPRLHLDLGAIGKGYALDQLAALFAEWGITTACLSGGGSTVLALDAPADRPGWPVGIGEGDSHRTLSLTHRALSGSGLAVQGEHIADPRTRSRPDRLDRTWALAPNAALSDALSTAFFVSSDTDIAHLCTLLPDIGAAWIQRDSTLATAGSLSLLIA
jgi:thiamine biosynthesis lipoprotein